MDKWALAVSSAETYIWYVAQGIPLIDADLPAVWQAGIAKKGHFWMETR
jgi:hypothetical protein